MTEGIDGGAQAFHDELAAYYTGRQFEFGFASMSRMTLPNDKLVGRRVLDVCCRRGKGAYKLSSRVGAGGWVVGIDWAKDYVDDAQRGMERAWRDNGLAANNMEFRVAYPEDLASAGFGPEEFDVVYINNVMTLLFDQKRALTEFARVLKPGGLLICETVCSDKRRVEAVVEAARSLGNSVQAGRTLDETLDLIEGAGFRKARITDVMPVEANQGFTTNCKVPVVETEEKVRFSAVAINALKA